VWTPLDLAQPCSIAESLAPVLASVVAAGLNMLRVPGIGCYEGPAFHDLCDELGILVWQDFMFANMDYPDRDEDFMATVRAEARQVLSALGPRPSLAVLCGGSEVAQQAAMMGLDPTVTGGALYEELLPAAIMEADVRVPYVPSSPWGGVLPFRPNRGVANYYGVGAYLRPLQDARLAEVRFAGECLAFANVPDEDALAELNAAGAMVIHHPLWKAGVPRDVGAGWDFEDVRDHYLHRLYGQDPVALRYADHERYLELSRHVSGEVMAEVFGEWRREASPCGGGLVLWLTDLMPGAGWGILDHRGLPKVAYHYLRRACAPVAIWSTDEGLSGVTVHVANDCPQALRATLRVTTYQDCERMVDEIAHPTVINPHGGFSADVEGLLGRFVDVSWAYRFGPPAQNLIVMSLESETDSESGPPRTLLAQTFRFPAKRPVPESVDRLGLTASLGTRGHGAAELTVATRRLAHGIRVHMPGFDAEDDAFSVEPGHRRTIALRRRNTAHDEPAGGHLTALNLIGRMPIAVE
jgi:beta-mannosidase